MGKKKIERRAFTTRGRIALFILALSLTLFSAATAQMYQYTDKNGNVVFTDNPPAGSNTGEVKMNNDRMFKSAPRRSDTSSRASVAPAEEQKRKRDNSDISVDMYMTSW